MKQAEEWKWPERRGKGDEGVIVKDKGGQIYGNGRECDFGGEHAMQHTDDVL